MLTLLNTKTPRMDHQNKVAMKMDVLVEEMANVLEHFRFDLQLTKNKYINK